MRVTPIDHTERLTEWLPLVDARTVASTLGVHVATLRRWIAAGVVPEPVRLGSRAYFRRTDLAALAQLHPGKIDEDAANRVADEPGEL